MYIRKTLFIVASLLTSFSWIVSAEGPDVIVNRLEFGREFGRNSHGLIGITAGTDSCNLGTVPLQWTPLSQNSNQHPVISLNLYRLDGERMQQLGMTWVKHGFVATNFDGCPDVPGAPATCSQPGNDGFRLLPGCTDLYPAGLNSNASFLGPRSQINPVTGYFDPVTAQDIQSNVPPADIEKLIMVEESDLQTRGGRYFIEAQYIASDDAAAGNAQNNFSHLEVRPILTAEGYYELGEVGGTGISYLEPSILEWQKEGAKLEIVETREEGEATSYIYVASKSFPLPNGTYRYEYAIFNMNSDIAVRALEVPVTGKIMDSKGFYAPKYYGERYSNSAWRYVYNGRSVNWQTDKSFEEDENANAIRWGTTYNFWFESTNPPTEKLAEITRFKPSTNPDIGPTFQVKVIAPQ